MRIVTRIAQCFGIASSASDADDRTPEQIALHYRIERELADRLRQANPADRGHLYRRVYDELFQRVPGHPMLVRRANEELSKRTNIGTLSLLNPFLRSDSILLEIGPGDCSLAIALCAQVKQVIAVDVSREIIKEVEFPENLTLLISDGGSVPVQENSISVAFSNQLIEHLHPDDALVQTENVFKALRPEGIYICLTPNRLSGPHDISQYFDETATGLHLREYTTTELAKFFYQAGFTRVHAIFRLKSVQCRIPTRIVTVIEASLDILPHKWRRALARGALVRSLIGVSLIATK